MNNEMDDFTAKVGGPTCSAWCRAPTSRRARQDPAQLHEPDDPDARTARSR
jgi:hypothetical protein